MYLYSWQHLYVSNPGTLLAFMRFCDKYFGVLLFVGFGLKFGACFRFFGGSFFAFSSFQSRQRNVFACLKPQQRQKNFTQVRRSVL